MAVVDLRRNALPADERTDLSLGLLIHDVSRLRKKVVDQALKPLGITRSQLWLLVTLSENDSGSMAQTEIAKMMSLGKVSLGGLIDRMETAGWLVRKTNTADRRAKTVTITDEGLTLLSDVRGLVIELNARIMDGLNGEERQIMEQNLQTIKNNLVNISV